MTPIIMLSLAIGILLCAVVNQNKKIADLEMKFDVYKDATDYTEGKLISKTQLLDDKLNTRTRELDDMYQSMNARLNKHVMEHIMKGGI